LIVLFQGSFDQTGDVAERVVRDKIAQAKAWLVTSPLPLFSMLARRCSSIVFRVLLDAT